MEKVKKYATAIYQNAMTGVQSIRDIIDEVEDKELKDELSLQAHKFNEICTKVEEFARKNRFEVQENNFFEKAKMFMSIKMSVLTDKSTRHSAEMFILGTVMGLTTCYKDQSDHKNVSGELDRIVGELEMIEEDNYSRLKKYLKKLN